LKQEERRMKFYGSLYFRLKRRPLQVLAEILYFRYCSFYKYD